MIFIYFNPDFECVVKIDSSDYVLGGVLSQYNKNSKLSNPLNRVHYTVSRGEVQSTSTSMIGLGM